MKKFKYLFYFLFLTQAYGQNYPNLSKLSIQIINERNSDSLNMASIFNWITDNIQYDVETYSNGLVYPEFHIDGKLDSASHIKSYNRHVSDMVIRNKKAVCDGYSRLFLTLCEYAGIQCKLITGKVKHPLRDELEEHTWNAVLIDNEWKLIDITWASGYLSGNSFVKEKDMFFYLTPPDQMIFDHIPDKLKWSLLDTAEAIRLLNDSPILSHQPFKNGLIEYFPETKVINTDTLKPFKLVFKFNRQIDPYDISVSGWPTELYIDNLNIEITNDNYDSLKTIYPNIFLVIPKIEILERQTVGNKVEFLIRPLSSSLEKIYIYIESSWPSLIYNVIF